MEFRGELRKKFYVYILASKRHGVLYIGVTSDLASRIFQHREGLEDGFTKRYWVHRLVYFEIHADAASAIGREKQLKRWHRSWKIELIEASNPEWHDLYPQIAQ